MPQRKISAEFFIIGSVLLDMIGIGIAFPTFPVLIGELTSNSSEQAVWYGILMATYAGMQFLCAPMMGALSDRFGRRPILLITIFGLAFHYFMIAIAPSVWVLLFARALGGVTGASFSVASAYLADTSPPEERAKAMGKIGIAFGLGFIIGPLLAGILGGVDAHIPFFVGAGCSALNLVYGYFFVPESLPADRRSPFRLSKANPFGALYALIRKHALGTFVAGFGVLALAQSVMIMGWVLYTQHRFGWGTRQNGYLFAVLGLLMAVVQGGLTGILVKRFGERRLALLSLAIAVVSNVLYGAVTEPWMMYTVMIASAVGFAGGPAIQGIISKTTPADVQGVTMGALQSIQALTGVIAPMIAAPIMARVMQFPADDWRVGASFYLAAALDAIAVLIIWRHISRVTPVAKPVTLGDLR